MQGIFFAGAHLVAGLTPAFIVGGGLLGGWPGMVSVMSWRGVFVAFGVVGLVWVGGLAVLVPERSIGTSGRERRGTRR